MRAMRYLRFLVLLLLCAPCFCQSPSAPANPGPTAPIPSDPHELATGPTRVALAISERTSVLGLVERAHQASDLTAAGGRPFRLEVSFEPSSGTLRNAGLGKMEETWLDPWRWGWSASLGKYTQMRIFLGGSVYDENSADAMPISLQMVRDAIFWSSPAALGLVRTTPATWNAKEVTCVLISGSGSREPTPGRRWVETEKCIDPKSGLLQISSVQPGIYAAYDYGDALKFQQHVLPRKIVIYENDSPVLRIRLDDIHRATRKDEGRLNLTAQMRANGAKAIAEEPVLMMTRVPAPDGESYGVIQPVIVHAMLGADGKISEIETLQHPSDRFVADAIEWARNLLPRTMPASQLQYQREVFLDVQFNQAVSPGIRPAITPQFGRAVNERPDN
jgi:hypothetical protein